MKIVIDLQSALGISRYRGIGRYSVNISKALARQAKDHEIYLLLNANSLEAIESVRADFSSLIPQNHIKVFETPKNISGHDHKNQWRIQAAEKIREHYLSSLSPDIVYITSPFEGWTDDAPISIGRFNHDYLTVATLYDLIPFIYFDLYIKKTGAPNFSIQKMQYLKNVDFLFTISNSTSIEAINYLSLPKERILNCSVGLDKKFKICAASRNRKNELKKYNITRDFIFYLGGFDFRKNIRDLTEAFSLLPDELRKKYQLVIIVSAKESEIASCTYLFQTHFKLKKDEVLLLKYVSEEELIILYNTCSLFVFPSFHEGFGLPIIEAMACGAPVISSNTSSMPEATGCLEALFNPKDPHAITKKIIEVLSNESLRNFLIQHGLQHVKKFTWENSAKKVLGALEKLQATKKKRISHPYPAVYHKKRLAYISPLPPEKTEISHYSTQVVPELACFYEIVLITHQSTNVDHTWLNANFPVKDVNWFIRHASRFDIILYQFSHSSLHYYMLDLLDTYPGIVVLHDFFLGKLFHWAAISLPGKENIFYRTLYDSHGFPSLVHHKKKEREDTIQTYPCNISVIKRALGVITHSKQAINLAKEWYGNTIITKFKWVPHPYLDKNITPLDKINAKEKLGFCENDFLICSFGTLHPKHLNHRLLSVFLNNLTDTATNNHLIFIGKIDSADYYNGLLNLIKKNKIKKNIHFIDTIKPHVLQTYLISTDISVQLGTKLLCETSHSLLNCLSYGIATITNREDSLNEKTENVILTLKEEFTDLALQNSIEILYKNCNLRQKLAEGSLLYIRKHHHPVFTAEQYYKAIENHYNTHFKEQQLIKNLSENTIHEPSEEDLIMVAKSIAANRFPLTIPQLLIDITAIKNNTDYLDQPYKSILISLLSAPPTGFRIEAIYYNLSKNHYYYATEFAARNLELFKLENNFIPDLPIEIFPEDSVLILNASINNADNAHNFIEKWHAKGCKVFNLIIKKTISETDSLSSGEKLLFKSNLKKLAEVSDGFICLGNETLQAFVSYLNTLSITRKRPLKIEALSITEEEITAPLITLLQKKQWSMEWEKTEIQKDLASLPEIINKKIYIGNKEYLVQGETRYLEYAGNPFEPYLMSIFKSFCQDDYQVLDLGANIGLTTIALANICKKGKVVALEPMPYTFELLRNNLRKTDIENIYLHNIGVGNKECHVTMQSHGNFLAGAFVADSFQQNTKQCVSSVNIPIKPLDNLINQLEIERVDFIKMDLEGYEPFALEGAKNIIKEFKPVVCLEMNHWCLNVFYRISLPEFRERLFDLFPYIFAIETTEQAFYLDFKDTNNFQYIAHEHLTKLNFSNLIAGFDKIDMLQKLSSAFAMHAETK